MGIYVPPQKTLGGAEGSIAFADLGCQNDNMPWGVGRVVEDGRKVVKEVCHGIVVKRCLGEHHEVIQINVCEVSRCCRRHGMIGPDSGGMKRVLGR